MNVVKNTLVAVFLFSFSFSFAQDKKSDFPRRNGIYAENLILFPVVYYDRLIPLGKKIGVTPRIGVGYYDELVPIFGLNVFMGGNKHFGEVGATSWTFEGASINAGYRFQSKKGFLAKAGIQFIIGEEAFPYIGLGYVF